MRVTKYGMHATRTMYAYIFLYKHPKPNNDTLVSNFEVNQDLLCACHLLVRKTQLVIVSDSSPPTAIQFLLVVPQTTPQ